jgi:signal transduction histidine kinase
VIYCRLVLHTAVVSTHFVYLSIVLAALWWGRRGLWVAALLALTVGMTAALSPIEEPVSLDMLRILSFSVVAVCVAVVSEKTEAARAAERQARRGLEEAQQRLVESARLASIGELSAGVAHELNNPLGTILLHTHALLRELPDEGGVRQDLELIAGEARRCRTIVRGLLNFARCSDISKAPTDIGAVIGDLLSLMAPHAQEKDAIIKADVPGDLPPAVVDEDLIRQLLLNLVQNAIDAVTDDGEVIVRARHKEDKHAIEIAVSDNGCGITSQVRAQLFTPFFTTKQPGRGTGLGLAMVYSAVREHSGEIIVDSEPGKGSTFTVLLPLRPKVSGSESVGHENSDGPDRKE